MNSHQLINQSSGKTEYYTDPRIVLPAQNMVGQFDLDPASSLKANEIIQAKKIYTEPAFTDLDRWDDLPGRKYEHRGGVSFHWYGTAWMNHPFGQAIEPCGPYCRKKSCKQRGWHSGSPLPGNAHWIRHLLEEYARGRVTEAFCLTFAATSEAWFKPLLYFPQCFLSPRTNYYTPDGKIKKGVTKGSVITYIGTRQETFKHAYAHLGVVK